MMSRSDSSHFPKQAANVRLNSALAISLTIESGLPLHKGHATMGLRDR